MAEEIWITAGDDRDRQALVRIYMEYFRAREELQMAARTIQLSSDRQAVDDASGPKRALVTELAAKIDAAWKLETCSVRLFAAAHGLDRTGAEIVLACIYEQSKPSLCMRRLCGSDVLAHVVGSAEVPCALERLLPTSSLCREDLLTDCGPKGESALMRQWRVPDGVVLELLGHDQASQLSSPESGSTKRSDRTLAEVLAPRFGFDGIVLAPAVLELLGPLLEQYRRGDRLFGDWGLGQQVHYGRGTTLLVYGPPGTGKTMLAEAIAGEVGAELMIAQFSQIEASLVGDTEKNLCRLFEDAGRYRRVLLIDECDAILCQRLSVARANERFYNQQLLILCQQIERFEGILIMTTNRASVLDQALDRRISLKLELPLPEAAEREMIWRSHLPAEMPLDAGVDLTALARRFAISGGLIKNAVIAAARVAMYRSRKEGNRPVIGMQDLCEAAEREQASFREQASERRIGFGPDR